MCVCVYVYVYIYIYAVLTNWENVSISTQMSTEQENIKMQNVVEINKTAYGSFKSQNLNWIKHKQQHFTNMD